MEWPQTASDHDAIVVGEETLAGLRFVVHGRGGPQFLCRTYAEAEAQALAYAEHARARVWYANASGFQLVAGFPREPVSSPTCRPAGGT